MPRDLQVIAEKEKECGDYKKIFEMVRNKDKAHELESDRTEQRSQQTECS